MGKIYRHKRRAVVKKKVVKGKRRQRARVPAVPRLIRNGMLPASTISTHTFSDSFSIKGISTETAGLLRYYANFVHTIQGTPTGVFIDKSSTPGTNDPYGSIREDPVPRGYDLMSLLYNKARVYSSSISVAFLNDNTDGLQSPWIGVYTTDDDQSFATPLNFDDCLGATIPGYKYRYSTTRDAGTPNMNLSKSFVERKMTKQDRIDNEYKIGDSPTAVDGAPLQRYNIVWGNVGNSTGQSGVMIVKIKYSMKWTEPNSFDADDDPTD